MLFDPVESPHALSTEVVKSQTDSQLGFKGIIDTSTRSISELLSFKTAAEKLTIRLSWLYREL